MIYTSSFFDELEKIAVVLADLVAVAPAAGALAGAGLADKGNRLRGAAQGSIKGLAGGAGLGLGMFGAEALDNYLYRKGLPNLPGPIPAILGLAGGLYGGGRIANLLSKDKTKTSAVDQKEIPGEGPGGPFVTKDRLKRLAYAALVGAAGAGLGSAAGYATRDYLLKNHPGLVAKYAPVALPVLGGALGILQGMHRPHIEKYIRYGKNE
jgi:hypothetical protein